MVFYPEHKIIVYSALHTGTWFVCNHIRDGAQGDVAVYADWWIRETYNETLEMIDFFKNGMTHKWYNEIIKTQARCGKEILPHENILVLQIHQRQNSPMYNYLMEHKPEIPVLVPVRDPLLSMNTRVWREAGTIKNLINSPFSDRKARAIDQAESLKRILCLPGKHVLKIPIDIERTTQEKQQVFKDTISYCGLKPDTSLNELAVKWTPQNPTQGGTFAQRNHHRVEEKEFVEIKNAIINNDIKFVRKFLSVELDTLQETLNPHKNKLKDLGYKNLCWWQNE